MKTEFKTNIPNFETENGDKILYPFSPPIFQTEVDTNFTKELIEENTGEYLAIPFGVSIATPSTLPNSTAINNNYVDVLVNQMVNDNIN